MPPWPGAGSPPSRRPGRSPSAARRPSWRPSSGRSCVDLRRRGKFLIARLDRDRIVFSPMLTGRFQLAAPGAPCRPRRRSSSGSAPRAGAPRDAARWTAGPTGCRPTTASAEVRYRDPTQMGKVYVLPAGVDRPVAGFDDDLGPDADDPALTLEVWRERIRRHPGRAEEPAEEPGVRRRHRQRLQRRDPARRPAAPVPEAVDASRAEEVDALYAATRPTSPTAIETSASACRRPSRSRPATGWRSTTRAGSPARGAGRGSARSSPAAS